MSAKERNSFERELQKDPFAEEAMEGLASINTTDASKDLLQLQKRIKSKSSRHKRLIIYRIAASVAVLLVISSVFLIVERNNSVRRLSSADSSRRIMEIAENAPIKAPVPKDEVKVSQTEEKEKYKKINLTTDIEKSAETAKGGKQEKELKTQELSVTDQIPDNELNAAGAKIADGQSASPMKSMVNERVIAPVSLKEQETKSDSKDFVSQDPSANESDEIILTGPRRSQAASKKDNKNTGYIPPQPGIGKEAFYKYLQENQQRPDSTTSGQRVVVVVSFMVRYDGKMDSIRIVRSADKLFSGEAIRLIRSGPSWKPAQVDGRNIDDEVSVKVIFK